MVAPHLLIAEVDPFEDVALTLELNFLPPLWVHVVIGGSGCNHHDTRHPPASEETLAGRHDQFRSNEEPPDPCGQQLSAQGLADHPIDVGAAVASSFSAWRQRLRVEEFGQLVVFLIKAGGRVEGFLHADRLATQLFKEFQI